VRCTFPHTSLRDDAQLIVEVLDEAYEILREERR
jgi:hypothetical protein